MTYRLEGASNCARGHFSAGREGWLRDLPDMLVWRVGTLKDGDFVEMLAKCLRAYQRLDSEIGTAVC